MHLHDQLASPAAHIVDRDDGRPPPTETDGLLTLATEDPPLAPLAQTVRRSRLTAAGRDSSYEGVDGEVGIRVDAGAERFTL